ncbi:MAG: hypothetical protein E6G92_04235 [Alphaproteobacteria bacterium]|nr:MAG: hypothetical protein E6G92_04235 [Alphaproteobacteria bacterium]
MTGLPIYITEGGLAALLDAEEGITNAVRIVEIGLTAEDFAAATTLEELPGEFTRLDTIAGMAASDRVLHMVARDDSTDLYTVRGFGLYLEGGQLFAVYGQADPIFQKASVSTFLLAADITFAQDVAELIEFGDTNFLYPPATSTTKGVAFLASAAEVAAGADAEKIVTPAALAGVYIKLTEKGAINGVAPLGADGKIPPVYLPPVSSIDTFTVDSEAEMLALAATVGDFARRTDEEVTYQLAALPASTLANWLEFLSPGAPVRSVNGQIGDVILTAGDVGAPPTSRTISATGLAAGGGNFAGNRTIDVPKASPEEALAGLIGDKALAPDSLALILALIAASTPAARQILTAGLAQGGGNLGADRTITVPKASSADVVAGTDDEKATTPAALAAAATSLGPNTERRAGGTIEQWGTVFCPASGSATPAPTSKSFNVSFPVQCDGVTLQALGNTNNGDESDEDIWVSSWTPAGFTISFRGDRAAASYFWRAIGK